MKKLISINVYWGGKNDWELRGFHIEDTLRESGFEILTEPLQLIWSPDEDALKMSIENNHISS